MNRNVESHFSNVPRMEHKRSVFDRSFDLLTTMQVGEVVPILCEEILAGDTVDLTTSKVVRLQTLLTPVMSNAYLDVYYFFVPNRILWSHWKEFMGENTQSEWIPQVEYKVPTVAAPAGGFKSGTLADYLGWPLGINWTADDPGAPTVLPLRAYVAIINDFFRDQNIQKPLVNSTSDLNITGSNEYGTDQYFRGGKPFIANKFHDYFTSCLPSPQKGPEVNIASTITGSVPVIAGAPHNVLLDSSNGNRVVPMTIKAGLDQEISTNSTGALFNGSGNEISWRYGYSLSPNGYPVAGSTGVSSGWQPNNLYASFGAMDPSQTIGFNFTVNALRLSVLTQMYYETLARSGSRYEEQLQAFFGVTNPDARVNHAEYLGGNRIQINVHEITNTAQSEQDFLGDLGAKSVTSDTHSDFVKSFTEHGWLMGLAVVRYDHTYTQGMPAKYTRKNKFDYYNPMFDRIGEQPVLVRELYADSNTMKSDDVFGYQEAWASYRYAPNAATGLMRPNVSGSFGHWTFADNYGSKPTLSATWLREDKTNVDRTLAVSSTVSPSVFADFYFTIKHTRPMSMFSVPGAIGAF